MGIADFAKRRVRRATRKALQELGRRGVADIRQSIDTPVTYVRGPRGGSIAIRSEPGEPPYREKRKLQKSVRYRVLAQAVSLTDLVIYTKYAVAGYLEYGTEYIEPRPFWEPARRRFERVAPSLFKSLFKEYFKEDAMYNPDPQVDAALPEEDM